MPSTEIAFGFRVRDAAGLPAEPDATPTATVTINGIPEDIGVTIVPASGTGQYAATVLLDVDPGKFVQIYIDADVGDHRWHQEAQAMIMPATYFHVAGLASGSPVTASGTIKALTRGDDYLAAHGRQLFWSVTLPGIDTTDATCHFGASSGSNAWLVEGTVSREGDVVTMTFDLPSSATIDLTPGIYSWTVELRSAEGKRMTQIRGTVLLEDSQTIPPAE